MYLLLSQICIWLCNKSEKSEIAARFWQFEKKITRSVDASHFKWIQVPFNKKYKITEKTLICFNKIKFFNSFITQVRGKCFCLNKKCFRHLNLFSKTRSDRGSGYGKTYETGSGSAPLEKKLIIFSSSINLIQTIYHILRPFANIVKDYFVLKKGEQWSFHIRIFSVVLSQRPF